MIVSSNRRGLVCDCYANLRRGLVCDRYAPHHRGLVRDRYAPSTIFYAFVRRSMNSSPSNNKFISHLNLRFSSSFLYFPLQYRLTSRLDMTKQASPSEQGKLPGMDSFCQDDLRGGPGTNEISNLIQNNELLSYFDALARHPEKCG